ncbi:MAG: Trk family potassium uptake protein [Clostridia bacterium]|nr:Trk family potassium uptake protein [Clostridia bacterium]
MNGTAPRSLRQRLLKPERILALGFLIAILAGALLLSMPFAACGRRSIGLRAALFTAASSVCVTGLSVIDVGTDLSLAGQIIQLLLIQLGGLGFMAFATLLMSALGRKMSLKSRLLLRESMNQTSFRGMIRLSLLFLLMAFAIEAFGALLLMIRLVPLYGGKGVWYSIFTAVSAFCNAGFDLFGSGNSLTHMAGEGYVLLVVAVLILLGGLGFSVILECLHNRLNWRAFSLHAKIVLCTNGILLFFGMFFTMLLEWRNPATLGVLTPGDRFINGFFQSVTLRTAGFAALDQSSLTDAGKLLSLPLLFIGASSASTGGGIKTTTAAMLMLLAASVIRGREQISLFGREISADTVRRAVTITLIGLTMTIISACAISVIESGKGFDMLDILFETTSAFSTAGLSSIGTGNLSHASQWLLIPLMYLGRVGPLTLALALSRTMERGLSAKVHYPEEKIMIG